MNKLTGTLLTVPEIPRPSLSTLDSFLAASPGQQYQAWFDYIAQEEEVTKPLSAIKLPDLRYRLEKLKPRSPEKAAIKKEIAEIENQIQEIKGRFETAWYESIMRIRGELFEYVEARFRGDEETIGNILDEFYETVGQGGYFENCPDRWFKHPSQEVLDEILKDAVNKGDLKPKMVNPAVLKEPITVPVQMTLW